jgi:hypothetical protein
MIPRLSFISDSSLYCALFLLGTFFPTSVNAAPSNALALAGLAASLLLLMLCMAYWSASGRMVTFVALPIVLVLTLATAIAAIHHVPFATIRIGELLPFMALGLVYSIRFERCTPQRPGRILALVSLSNLVIGSGLIIGNNAISRFVLGYYSYISDEHVTNMLELHKPVLTFAIHSFAGLFIYLFFYLNLRAYRATGKRLHLLFALLHVLLCAALMSHTSFVLTGVALLELFWLSVRRMPKLTIATAAVALYLIPLAMSVSWHDVGNVAVSFWRDREGAGFAGRFGSSGDQFRQIEYLKSSILPIGLNDSPTINPFGIDSAPLDYLIRGSLPLLLLMYGGLWLFLRRTLPSRIDRYHLFFAILACESGVEVLTYYRIFCLLPAFVVCLRGLPQSNPHGS